MVALSQINRAAQYQAENWAEEPDLQHLAESGGFESNADTVLILWRNRKEEKAAIENREDIPTHGKIAKNRNGREDYFNFKLDGAINSFWEDVI